MKSRVVIWVIVGLVAVLGIVFLLATPRGPRVRIDDKLVETQLAKSETKLAKLEEEIAQVKSGLAPGVAQGEKWAELDRLAAEAHAKINEVKAEQGAKAAYARLREAQEAIADTRRMFRNLVKEAPRVQNL
ncbi:MAG: hypothetical protein JSU73_10725 [candidate division WOR-3 bacterium]|nr:MAG: hypothetical protein JSU73_10725 [candidate division WOR-3 bacterium]